MRKLALSTLVFASLAATTACSELPPGTACTEIAITSVNLTLFDLDTGEPVLDADVQYAVDGGDFQPCENWGEDNTFQCGVEEAGAFEIVVDAEGYELLELELDVDEDECHVIGHDLEEDLVPIYEAG